MPLQVPTPMRVFDISDKFTKKLDSNLSFVKFEYLKGNNNFVKGVDFASCHYPIDDMIPDIPASKESLENKLENFYQAQQVNLNHQINEVLFTGISKNRQWGDVDFYKESNQARPEMSLEDAEKYLQDLGYLDTLSYSVNGKQVLLPISAKKLITVYFSPANRFHTVNTIAKEIYAFSYENPKENVTELMCESNYRVSLDYPELVVQIKN